jgi:hypothetical protein
MTMEHAILREKRIKKWLRRWKMELIERDNLGWRDLTEDLGFPPLGPTGSPLSRNDEGWCRCFVEPRRELNRALRLRLSSSRLRIPFPLNL